MILSPWDKSMQNQELDLIAAKALVADWIRQLTVADPSFPHEVTNLLLEQLERASPLLDRTGVLCLEIPGLVSLGSGIFQCSFRVKGVLLRVVPYAPNIDGGRSPGLPPSNLARPYGSPAPKVRDPTRD